MEQSFGIIIRIIPHSHFVWVLDVARGKVRCSLKKNRLAGLVTHGAHITYTIVQTTFGACIELHDIVSGAFALARDDIAFFHHVLELYMELIPEGIVAEQLFELLDDVHSGRRVFKTVFERKLFLCTFFLLLEVYPEDESLITCINQLILQNNKSMLNDEGVKELHKKIDVWLMRCLGLHAHHLTLKTLYV